MNADDLCALAAARAPFPSPSAPPPPSSSQVLVQLLSAPEPVVLQALKALRLLADTQNFHKVLVDTAFEALCTVVLTASVPTANLCIFGVLMKLVREPRNLKRLIVEDRLLLLKSCVEEEGVDNAVRHASLRVLLRLIEHRTTADAMVSNHVLPLLAAMLAVKDDAEDGDNLSHKDTVRTLRALCFLAHNERAHEDVMLQARPQARTPARLHPLAQVQAHALVHACACCCSSPHALPLPLQQ